jgi:hypothetical protein
MPAKKPSSSRITSQNTIWNCIGCFGWIVVNALLDPGCAVCIGCISASSMFWWLLLGCLPVCMYCILTWVPTNFAKNYLVDIHVEEYRQMVETLTPIDASSWREGVKKSWNTVREQMEKWQQTAKENYISKFTELKPIAEAFFDFYLYEKRKVDQDMIATSRELMTNQQERKRFEERLGKKNFRGITSAVCRGKPEIL